MALHCATKSDTVNTGVSAVSRVERGGRLGTGPRGGKGQVTDALAARGGFTPPHYMADAGDVSKAIYQGTRSHEL